MVSPVGMPNTNWGVDGSNFVSTHPAIPTEPNGGNHTPSFARSARTDVAHAATMVITKGLALVGYRLLADDVFFAKVSHGVLSPFNTSQPSDVQVREAFEERKVARR